MSVEESVGQYIGNFYITFVFLFLCIVKNWLKKIMNPMALISNIDTVYV